MPSRRIAKSAGIPVVLMKEDVDGMLVPVPDPTPVGGGGGSGGLTDAQLRATPVPVSDGGSSLTVDGTVAVSNFPASQPVTGPLTDAQLRATAVPVSGPLTDAQLRATAVPVSGTVAVSNMIPAVETGLAKDGTDGSTPPAVLGGGTGIRGWLRSIYEKLTGTIAVTGTFWQATQPVSGTFWQATQPVSGPLTDAQLRATPVPVSGTVTATGPLTDTQLRATPVPVSGAVNPSPLLLGVTATGAAAAAVTLTLPAVASQFHYISHIEITLYNSAARTGSATPVVVTSTNLPGSNAWTWPSAGAIGTVERLIVQPDPPIRSSVVNTATTIVCPATTGIIWRVNVFYRTAT